MDPMFNNFKLDCVIDPMFITLTKCVMGHTFSNLNISVP